MCNKVELSSAKMIIQRMEQTNAGKVKLRIKEKKVKSEIKKYKKSPEK